MKKMIRFTVLLLLITGVFIFSSGEKVAAATNEVEIMLTFDWDAVTETWSEQASLIYFKLLVYKDYFSDSLIAPNQVNSNFEFSDIYYDEDDYSIYLIYEDASLNQVHIIFSSTGITTNIGDIPLDLTQSYHFVFTVNFETYDYLEYDGFNVYQYNYEHVGIFHSINISTFDLSAYQIFSNGYLISNLGIPVNTDRFEVNLIEIGLAIYDIDIDDSDSWGIEYAIGWANLNQYVFVENIDSTKFQAYGFPGTSGLHDIDIDEIDLDNLIIFANGNLIYEFGVTLDSNYNIHLITSDFFIYDIVKDDTDAFNRNGSYENYTGNNYVIIQYIPSEPEPDPEYTITFNTNGGSAVDPIVVTEGAMLYETIWNPPVETTRSGYTFDDWYKNAGLTIPVTESDTVTSDLTLYANWILNVVNYTVTFNTNGGSYIAPQSIVSGEQATRPTDPVRTGYTFNGWYSEMFFINLYNFNSAVSDNITLYAQWTLAEDPIEDEDDAWDTVIANLPWIILGLVFFALLLKSR